MNRVVAWIAVALLMGSVAYSQSLGDVARQNRQAKQTSTKKAAHVYTNDEIPSVPVIREAPKSATAADGAPANQKPADAQSPASENKGEAAKAAPAPDAKDLSALRAQVQEQRKAVELLERELNVAQREHQIQTAVFYTDAGSRLRDPKDWAEKQKKFEEEMTAKSKALEDAKQKLQNMEDEARRESSASTTTPSGSQ